MTTHAKDHSLGPPDGLSPRMKALTEAVKQHQIRASQRTTSLQQRYTVRAGRREVGAGFYPPAGPEQRMAVASTTEYDRGAKAGPKGGPAPGSSMVRDKVSYITRDGQELFGRDGLMDGQKVAQEWGSDRKLFQVVVSPNDGHRLDMQEYARAVVARWEQHTGPLEWVAAVHEKPDMAHAQGNRHVHVLIRGVQDGRDIRFSQAVIQHGFREMAREVATERLGPMSKREQRDLERQKSDMAERRIEAGAMGSKRDLAERRTDRGIEQEREI
jgi:hypothetical protein